MSLGNSSGFAGTLVIVVACTVVSGVISFVTGTYSHWLLVAAGIIVGLMAVSSIRK
jgi:hypothetical protein